ncbi:MAG: DUF4424 family protein [Armatimonadota bacterium]|nr:DUF4424 family protein [Armatimonadota bacterium]
MRRTLVILSVLLLPLPIFANDTAMIGAGGTVEPMRQHDSIRLIKERVDVRLMGLRPAKVRCEFLFKNEGKSPVTVKMGFPVHASGDVRPIKSTNLRNFRSYVDGKPIKTRFAQARPTTESQYKAWYVKNVSFAPGQTRKVVDIYGSPLGDAFIRTNRIDHFFHYILTTGRNWKGPIGEAVIAVDISYMPKGYVLEAARPNNYFLRGSRLTWTMRNFEPNENIGLDFGQSN